MAAVEPGRSAHRLVGAPTPCSAPGEGAHPGGRPPVTLLWKTWRLCCPALCFTVRGHPGSLPGWSRGVLLSAQPQAPAWHKARPRAEETQPADANGAVKGLVTNQQECQTEGELVSSFGFLSTPRRQAGKVWMKL